ncbi:hypothetical protein B0T18DRAFT_410254 [Schizothecium vesticola]|uniref:C2H2-type domain-containing protein n=1 Tax=Schizothecium vesticola TaxID=314040 RepID=A0AA40K519_9PEZI|nr:hypothetical protein B0T18DRAFT_410254 [Schizothecium vesticola]
MAATIAAAVSRCLLSFEILLSALVSDDDERATVASHLARFKLWVGTLGAHRESGSRSLEYRLRDASSIKNHIVSLLQDLCNSVNEGVSEAERTDLGLSSDKSDGVHQDPTTAELEEYFRDDDDTHGASELSDVLDEIGHTIDCLLRLSITIRNPAPHDHFRSRTGAGLVDFYEPWDVKHAREKFPKAEQGIAERLGKATSRRRQYFKYREEHAKKLAEGLDEVSPEEPDRDRATTIASSIPRHLKGIETTDHLAEFDDTESNVSKTSYAPSNADASLLRVPPLPKEYVDGPFKCPFCCMIVSIRTRGDWKKHVFRDLRPYVCLVTSCATPEQLYLRRGDWIDHMKQDHWKAWRCPFACSHLLHSKLDFLTHIKQSHPEGAFARTLDTLESLSSQPDLAKAKGTCPLCPFSIASHTQYASHVAKHVEQLALFALPTSQGADHSDEDDSEASSAAFVPYPPSSDSSDGDDKHVAGEELVAGGDGVHASARDEMSASLIDDAPTLRSAASRDSQAPPPPPMAPVVINNYIHTDNSDGDSEYSSSRHDGHRRAHGRTSSNGSSNDTRERYELERVERARAELEVLRLQNARKDDESRTASNDKRERYLRQDEEERRYKDEADEKDEEGRKQREKDTEEAVAKWKAKEAARIENERLEKEYANKALRKRLLEDLPQSGLSDKQIEAIVEKVMIKKEKEEQEVVANRPVSPLPTYTRMSLQHLAFETLSFYKIEWEYDQVPGYVLIKRWVPEWEQDMLWEHTTKIRREQEVEYA